MVRGYLALSVSVLSSCFEHFPRPPHNIFSNFCASPYPSFRPHLFCFSLALICKLIVHAFCDLDPRFRIPVAFIPVCVRCVNQVGLDPLFQLVMAPSSSIFPPGPSVL